MSLARRDVEAVWHPYTQAKLEGLPIAITSAKEAVLFDENGKQYIDAVSSWWVNLHGHAHPYISQCIKSQLEKMHHVMFAGFTHQPAIDLAEGLRGILPDPKSKIFFSDNGSTAVEVAIKMAAQYWFNLGSVRKRIIALEGSYHGDTIGAMSASSPSPFRAPYESYMFNVAYIPRPENGKALEALQSEISKDDVAAFIFEPLIQGASGMHIYAAKELNELVKLCRDNSIITIADEVFTGFGRTGRIFASNYLDANPDIFCLSKGLTGGTMALGVTSAPERIYQGFESDSRKKMFLHGHSYTANPLACTAGVASLSLLLSTESALQRSQIQKWQHDFALCLKQQKNVLNVRTLGTILAFEIESKDSTSYLNPLRDKLYKHFIDNGVIIRPLGNTIYTVPPYCISEEQMNKVNNSIITSLELA